MRNTSNEEVIANLTENPYRQYFCNEQYFCRDLPIDPSLMTLFRHQIGLEGCELILGLTVQTGLTTKTIDPSSLSVINLDASVQNKAMALPAYAYACAQQGSYRLGQPGAKGGVKLHHTYTFNGQSTFAQSAQYAHARQFN